MIDYTLKHGPHAFRQDGMCAMEWVAYLAGERHTDAPACVSPVLARFCTIFNDSLPDEKRQRLRPYLTRTIGTKGDGLDEQRAYMCIDWLIREYAPKWLDLCGFPDHARTLHELDPVTSGQEASEAHKIIAAARDDASAVRDSAGDDLQFSMRLNKARTPVLAAARASSGSAADAAWVGAAWGVAGDKAIIALQSTVDDLQESSFDLLERMLPTESIALPVEQAKAYRELCKL